MQWEQKILHYLEEQIDYLSGITIRQWVQKAS